MEIIKTLEELRQLSGNAQLEKLAQHTELKEILEWTYNPFKKYYFTVNSWANNSSGYSIVNNQNKLYPEAIDILTALSDRSLSGIEADERIQEFMVNLKEEWAKIFACIINKDLRLNLGVKSINKVFPGLIPLTEDGDIDIPIMLLKTWDIKKQIFRFWLLKIRWCKRQVQRWIYLFTIKKADLWLGAY